MVIQSLTHSILCSVLCESFIILSAAFLSCNVTQSCRCNHAIALSPTLLSFYLSILLSFVSLLLLFILSFALCIGESIRLSSLPSLTFFLLSFFLSTRCVCIHSLKVNVCFFSSITMPLTLRLASSSFASSFSLLFPFLLFC